MLCQLAVKRGLDIALSLVLIVTIFVPLLICAVVIVYRNYPGGAMLYYDWRAGKDGKPFRCWKLRTLPVGYNPLVSGAMPVSTSIRHIRRVGIDELPQLPAILMGKMSFCGNRALLAKEAKIRYGQDVQTVLGLRPGFMSLFSLRVHNDNEDYLVLSHMILIL